jgi:hypothetical protein
VSDENTNDSGSDSKIDYNTKHVYFYLPKVPTEDGEVADNIDLGAMLRLGGYCDLEQQAHKLPADELHYYPQKYIDTQGAGSENIFKKSAGSSTESSHGILMACDGHFLLKAAEKMFVETGDHHLQVNGDYEHDTTGSVNVQSGDIMTLKSGTNKKLTLNAGDKSGDMELLANNKTETVQGDNNNNTSGNKSDSTKGNNTITTWGLTMTYSLDVAYSAFAAGQIVTSSWGLQLYLATLVKVYPVSEVVLAGMRFQATGLNMASVQTQVGYKALSVESRIANLRSDLTKLDGIGMKIQQTDLEESDHILKVRSEIARVNSGEVEASTKGVVVFV